jgi:hypothetical protein
MTVWEMVRDAMGAAHASGRPWLRRGEIVRAVEAMFPGSTPSSIAAHASGMCINDPSRKHYPGRRYRNNPLLVTDDPTMHGKRYRLLTESERQAYLSNARDDLELVSYAVLLEWLQSPATTNLDVGSEAAVEPLAEPDTDAEITGPALLELHLQDYIYRNWASTFPGLTMFEGANGREYVTSSPGVGILDFLATDAGGNFVVIETKRNTPDRQAVGQILGYMGWVQTRLCTPGTAVRGILLCGEVSDQLRMAVTTVPSLELKTYEISFRISPAT